MTGTDSRIPRYCIAVVQEATTPPKTRATLAEKNEELIGKVQNEIAQLLLQSATDDALSGVSKKFNDDLAKLVMKTDKVHEEHARNQKGFQGGWGRCWRIPIRSSTVCEARKSFSCQRTWFRIRTPGKCSLWGCIINEWTRLTQVQMLG